MAMKAEIAMKNRTRILIVMSCDFCEVSLLAFFLTGTIISRVSVDDYVSTREERVDMEAESTSTMTIATMIVGSPSSIDGMMLS